MDYNSNNRAPRPLLTKNNIAVRIWDWKSKPNLNHDNGFYLFMKYLESYEMLYLVEGKM